MFFTSRINQDLDNIYDYFNTMEEYRLLMFKLAFEYLIAIFFCCVLAFVYNDYMLAICFLYIIIFLINN